MSIQVRCGTAATRRSLADEAKCVRTWTGSAREGTGVFQVGSGAVAAPFTYNSRFRGDGQTNPEELLLSALAGCLTMAMAAALHEQDGTDGWIETRAELDLVPCESGSYRIPTMRWSSRWPE